MARIPKGQTVPLNVTQEAQHRIKVGLGWDPNEDVSFADKALGALGLKDTHHDLDLSCYIYDKNKRYIGHVSHEDGRGVDQTGKIYHSGDNVEGIGDGDDEQISVELKDLDASIHTIVFKASIKTKNTFDEVNDPEIRIADGYSGHNFLHVSIAGMKDNRASAFVFVCVMRTNDGGWALYHCGEFTALPDHQDWAEHLKDYIP